MSSEGYTVKEMLTKVLERQEEQLKQNEEIRISQAISHVHDEATNKHLAQLNGKVATHEKKIVNLGTFQTRVMTAWGLSIAVVTTVISRII